VFVLVAQCALLLLGADVPHPTDLRIMPTRPHAVSAYIIVIEKKFTILRCANNLLSVSSLCAHKFGTIGANGGRPVPNRHELATTLRYAPNFQDSLCTIIA
jgi:hypothetical protein